MSYYPKKAILLQVASPPPKQRASILPIARRNESEGSAEISTNNVTVVFLMRTSGGASPRGDDLSTLFRK
jgi:hypothetical protein